jgi:hypothetical protein
MKFFKFHKIFYVFVFLVACLCNLSAKNENDLDDFDADLDADIEQVIAEKYAKKRFMKKYNVEEKIKKEIEDQQRLSAKKNLKNRVYKTGKIDKFVDKNFVYKVPAWPFYSLFYMQKMLFQFDMTFDFATKAYMSSWGKKDLSRLVFGQKDAQIQDILVVSRLLKSEKVDSIPAYALDKLYFYILADQHLGLDASFNKQSFSFNIARHFWKGSGNFGIQLPIVRCENKVHLSDHIGAKKHEQLENAVYPPKAGPNFFVDYGTLPNFFKNILKHKDIDFHKTESQVGFGDLTAFLNFEINWKRCERLILGLSFLFPTAKGLDAKKLWDPQLGNGGFPEIAIFNSWLFHESRFFNPHILGKITVCLPDTVTRRVPKLISYDGEHPTPGDDLGKIVIFGDYAIYTDAFKPEPDSTLKYFADKKKRVDMIPSPEFWLRIGNMFEKFFWTRAFFDIFYDFRIKGKDFVRKRDLSVWDYSVLTKNSDQIENNLGANFSYQFDNHFRANLGFIYTFAGRNVPELFKLDLSLNFEV